MVEVVLLVGLASGVLALAISRARIFRWLRELVWPGHDAEPPAPRPPGVRGWAGYLLTCWLCLGAWLCAALWAVEGLPGKPSGLVLWAASWAVSTLLAAAVDRLTA